MITIPTFTGASTALAATLTTSLAPLIMLLVEAPMLEKVGLVRSLDILEVGEAGSF